MSANLFFEAVGELGDRYYEEAARYRRGRAARGWGKWAVAACLAVAAAAALSVLPSFLNRQGAPPPIGPGGDLSPGAPEIRIGANSVFLNDIAGFSDAARRRYDPALYDWVEWDREEVTGYYGGELTPAYIPAGLIASPQNGTAVVIADKSGSVVLDTVWLAFYQGYYEDGSPKQTEGIAARKGISVRVSKLGLFSDCAYLLPESEVRVSDIRGTAVTFGYRSMPCGPYDPETHEPAGHYDMYVAEFERGEIQYQIVAEQVELEELVKVVSSIVSGEGAGNG